jgi:multiple sugar transport system ATP-binding protein
MIELRNVTRRFGSVTVLEGISLAAEHGSFLALLGPSGCGKSTLLRIIAGLDRPNSGTVLIGGRDVAELTAAQRNIAMVFQSYALYPHLTVAQNIALPLAMRGQTRLERSIIGRSLPSARAKRAQQQRQVREVAAVLGIEQLLARKPAQLSGGQKQRVAVARALVRDPSVFLLDEPLSNLDAKLRVQMRAEIVALNRRIGRTFIHVTHDQAEAMAMADKVAVMLDGTIAQFGTPRDLYETPASRDVAAFVGTHPINFIGPAKPGGLPQGFQVAGLDAANGAKVVVGVRPEHLVPSDHGAVEGRLVRLEYQGAEMLLDVRIEDGSTIRALAPGDWQAANEGDRIRLGYAPRNLHVFDAATGKRLLVEGAGQDGSPQVRSCA